ncbi:hypothetical protein [Maribacter sp. 2308TA10-17]|uniref:hypothetical protein n=1 Tax=Maribacter sp. 2308TA10-17 TaxID=3386276 RepID=UPI0039BCC07E
MKKYFLMLILTAPLFAALGQNKEDYRPSLFFREDWTEAPEHSIKPLSQKFVSNQDLLLNVYGTAVDSLSKSHHDKPVDDPYYIWSGRCLGSWMVSLKHKTKNVDLTGAAKIRWRTKQAGFRKLHLTLKLADGTWLVSDFGDGKSKDWRTREIIIGNINWFELDMELMSEMRPVENPDLSNVTEVGFTDLMSGGRWFACSRLDWIEVYGIPSK